MLYFTTAPLSALCCVVRPVASAPLPLLLCCVACLCVFCSFCGGWAGRRRKTLAQMATEVRIYGGVARGRAGQALSAAGDSPLPTPALVPMLATQSPLPAPSGTNAVLRASTLSVEICPRPGALGEGNLPFVAALLFSPVTPRVATLPTCGPGFSPVAALHLRQVHSACVAPWCGAVP